MKMMSTLLVSQDTHFFNGIEEILSGNGLSPEKIFTGKNVLSLLEEKSVRLLIIDENLPDMTGKELVEQVIQTNPMIDCVIASPMSHDAFHDAYEGMGVLMQFTPMPGPDQARQLIDHLKKIKMIGANR